MIAATSMILSMLVPSLSSAADNSLNSKQTQTLRTYFSGIASSQPAKIDSAKKSAANNSPAQKFLDLIQKHFIASEFFKVRDSYGNVSPLIHDPKGTYKLSKNVVTLDSYFNEIDGKYSNFKFNKSGKLIDFTFETSDGKKNTISNNIFGAILDYKNDGIQVSSGYVWKKPNGNALIQLKVTNIDAGLFSWSYTNGRYVSADGVFHSVSTVPLGCVNDKGVTYLEAVTTSAPVLALETQSVLVAPFFDGCRNATKKERYLTFTLK